MNLLPFVMIIVLVLGLFSLSQFQSSLSLEKTKDAYVAYFKGKREVRNQREALAYEESIKESKWVAAENEEKDLTYFRERWIGSSYGRINLFSLVNTEIPDQYFYKLVSQYLEKLYGQALFSNRQDKDMCKKLLDQLLKIQKKSFKETGAFIPLFQIELGDPCLQSKYYKMLKGTHTYNRENNEGYLSLVDVIEFTESTDKPIKFNYINVDLMETIFGNKLAEQVIEEEGKLQHVSEKQRKNYALKEERLREVLYKGNFTSANEILSILSFQSFDSNPPIKWTDPKTNITVKQVD